MTAVQLYKFINENNIEYHWQENDGIDDVLIFTSINHIEDFNKLMEGSNIYDDAGISCMMKDGYFAFWMDSICEYFGIELLEIFVKS